jgi:predicted ester cyclase
MADSPRQVAERWFDDVWNQGRRESIDELLAPDCVIHNASEEILGPSGFKAFYDNIHNSFSEVRVAPELSICEGDYVSVRWVSSGKHRDTGRNIKITGMSLMRFHDGRVAEAWQNWDLHGMMQQIEAAPKAMAAEAR